MSGLVRRSDRAGGAVLTLDSPRNRNALSRALVAELGEHLAAAASDPQVRAVVLTATGNTFCAGADLADPPVSSGPGSYPDLLRTLYGYPKPLVAAVNGHVRAGGFGMVAVADVVLCASSATFAFTEVRIGVAPAIIAVLCLRRMTPLSVSRYFLTGETFGPEDAKTAGLVGTIVDDGDLDAEADKVLDMFRLGEPGALGATRALIRDVQTMGVEVGFDYTQAFSERQFSSPEAAEGIAAFKERRPPRWAR